MDGCVVCGGYVPEGEIICNKCKAEIGCGQNDKPAIHKTAHEGAEQEAIFEWAEYNKTIYPELEMLYHIPNGGRRNKFEARALKRQGVKAGVPDICLPVARSGFHGLYIEMKYGNNKQTESQKKWERLLIGEGYAHRVCYSWQSAVEILKKYLKGALKNEN